jgi:hypothetical protein
LEVKDRNSIKIDEKVMKTESDVRLPGQNAAGSMTQHSSGVRSILETAALSAKTHHDLFNKNPLKAREQPIAAVVATPADTVSEQQQQLIRSLVVPKAPQPQPAISASNAFSSFARIYAPSLQPDQAPLENMLPAPDASTMATLQANLIPKYSERATGRNRLEMLSVSTNTVLQFSLLSLTSETLHETGERAAVVEHQAEEPILLLEGIAVAAGSAPIESESSTGQRRGGATTKGLSIFHPDIVKGFSALPFDPSILSKIRIALSL